MEETNKPLKIDEIIGLLDKANKTLETKVSVASIPDKIDLAPLNAFHTKNIIKSAASGLFYDYQFTIVFYNILKEITKFSLDKLSIADKAVLLLELRSKNISDELEVEVKGTKKVDDKDVTDTLKHKVKVSKVLSKLSFKSDEFEEKVVETPEYSVVLRFPSIKEEYDFTDHLYKNKIANVDEENKVAIKGLIAPVFVYTLAPYVKKLKIGEKEISLEGKKVDERLAVIEKLSANMITKIMQKIEDTFALTLNKISEVEVEKDDVKYKGFLKLDAELFIQK